MGFALLSAAWIAGSATPPAAMESLPAAMGSLEVTIVVDNLRSTRGQVQIALWSGPDGFADADAAIVETGRPARPGEVRPAPQDWSLSMRVLVADFAQVGSLSQAS